MLRIFKYPVSMTDEFTVEMPKGARVLDVQVQHGSPVFWAVVNPEAPNEVRHFRLAGTGHPITDSDVVGYVGTFQLAGGDLILHLFEAQP